MEITDEKVGDHNGFKSLLEQLRKNHNIWNISRVLADGAYDRADVFNLLNWYDIKSGVKMRKDANPKNCSKSYYRRKCICRRDQIGYEAWKQEVGYTMRWASENVFSSVKRMFGESVRSRSKEGALRDAYRKFVIYNVLNNFGKGKISEF